MLWSALFLYAAVGLYAVAWLFLIFTILSIMMVIRNRLRGSSRTLTDLWWGSDPHSR